MAKLVFGMNMSLDGYIDHMKMGPPGPVVYRYFLEHMRGLVGIVYGRGMYEVMRYWDDDQEDWGETERAFAAAWRSTPKWVVSRSLKSVGPNATLVAKDFAAVIAKLKAEMDGEIEVGGPKLAQSLGEAGLIDAYQIYLRPVVVGSGKTYFAGTPPKLRLVASDVLGEDVVRLTYVPA